MLSDPVSELIRLVCETRPGAWVKVRNKKPAITILVRMPGQKRGKAVASLLHT